MITDLAGTASYASGQAWDLFHFSGGTSSAFNNTFDSNIVTGLPNLGSGLKWEFDYGSGMLSIANALSFSGSATWNAASTTGNILWSTSAN